MNTEKTIGEKRVRTDFNMSSGETYDLVLEIKNKTAELINMVDVIKHKDPRLASIAQTDYEKAAMWAVKLATS